MIGGAGLAMMAKRLAEHRAGYVITRLEPRDSIWIGSNCAKAVVVASGPIYMSDLEMPTGTVQKETAASVWKQAVKDGKVQELLDNSSELYRHYDSDGRLLYIGVSLSSLERLADHRQTCSWFKLIKVVTIDRYPTRALAFEAEREAIKKEKPYFNRKHRRGWRDVKLTRSTHTGATAADMAQVLKQIAKKQEPKN